MATPAPAITADSGTVSLSKVDGVLVVSLDPKARFEALRQCTRELFAKHPDRFRGFDARLDLATRKIDLFDLRRLVHLLRDEFGVTVTALYCTQTNLTRFAERELKLKVYTETQENAPRKPPAPEAPKPATVVVQAPKPAPAVAKTRNLSANTARPKTQRIPEPNSPDLKSGGARLQTIDRSLRSGQKIHFDGDVVVFGDINPGAEVIASGNIMVFGALKGMAHAGARGDDGGIIISFDFRPTQLRIGRKIALPPDQIRRGGGRVWSPEVAWVQGGQIIIEPYQGRLPR